MNQISFIESIDEISKIEEMFQLNNNNIFIMATIGQRDLGIEKELERNIKNLKNIHTHFNINEIFIFRTFDFNKIIIYTLFEKRLYILNCYKKIINVVLSLDNYITLIFENNFIEVIRFKDMTSIVLEKQIDIIETINIYELIIKLDEDKKLFHNKINYFKDVEPFLLPFSKVNQIEEDKNNYWIPNDNDNKIYLCCERIWSYFILQVELCYCVSIIEYGIRKFKYITIINNNKMKFNTAFDLIKYINNNFLDPLSECTFLILE